MSDDNILEFPGGLNQAELEQKQREGMHKVVETVEKNRREGQERLEKQISRIKDMAAAGRSADALLDEVEVALEAMLTTLDALNQFVEMLKQDLVGLVSNLENQAMGGYSTSLHLEALLSVLLEKGSVTDAEMKAAFIEAQKRMHAQMQAMHQGATPDQSE